MDAVCYELQNDVTVIDLDRELQYAEYEQVATDLEDQRLLWLEENLHGPLVKHIHAECVSEDTTFPKKMTTGFAFLGELEKCGYNATLVESTRMRKHWLQIWT